LTSPSSFAIGLRLPKRTHGQVAEWLKAADCKSARESVRWFESNPVHHYSTILLNILTIYAIVPVDVV
jgi:hypothetical protein